MQVLGLESLTGMKSLFAAALLSQSQAIAPASEGPAIRPSNQQHQVQNIDVQPWSNSPHLQTVLLTPGTEFTVSVQDRNFREEISEFRDREKVERTHDEF